MQRYFYLYAGTRHRFTTCAKEESIMKRYLLCCVTLFMLLTGTDALLAAQRVVNIYGWSNEVPPAAIRQFERETGIKVNFSTYENNEIMYSKLRTTPNAGYDLIMPSSYF